MLLQLGCELAQGYGIARPMPASDFPDWLHSWCPDPVWHNLTPVKRDDMPLLFAGVEHRAWIVAVDDLNGKAEILPAIHHQCRFDLWLESVAKGFHGDKLAFRSIVLLHRQIHLLADDLCDLHAQGRTAQALSRISLNSIVQEMICLNC